MLLARCGNEPFENSEATELRAVAYRIALAIENRLLHKRMKDQLAQLHRLQQLTAALAGTLDLDAVGQRVADTLISEAAVSASVVLIDRSGELIVLASGGAAGDVGIGADGARAPRLDERWKRFRSRSPTRRSASSPSPERRQSAPSSTSCFCISSAWPRSRSTRPCSMSRAANRRGTTPSPGCSATACFTRCSTAQIAAGRPVQRVLFDIDDFKQVNDLHGHQTGDHALRLVSDALPRRDAQRRQRVPDRGRGVLRAAARARRAGRLRGGGGHPPEGRRDRRRRCRAR